ncbi:hypothetical protein F5Y14DRAFT_432389 [Nemania sp. NC0429]|nr:hypothetical protein F5Y14DRAFT_432389 [Nemania sp. NC0429]
MGWLWSSGPAPATRTTTTTTEGNPRDFSTRTTTSTATTESQSAPKAPEPTTYSDPEIAKFLAQLQAEFGSPKPPTQTTVPGPRAADASPNPQEPAPASSSSSWWPSLGSSSHPTQATTPSTPTPTIPSSPSSQAQAAADPTPNRLDPVSEALLPTTMSCRSAFDAAFHCNSLGGQWLSVYREGGVRSCSEHWDDFWFCMRTRAYSGPAKADAIRDHYRRKEVARYHAPGKPSSLDVWEARTEMLPPGTAFSRPYVKPDVSDEEWRLREMEYWRAVREGLKAEEDARVAAAAEGR